MKRGCQCGRPIPDETRRWLNEVRAKRAEDKLPPPALVHPRTLCLNPSRLAPTPPRPCRVLSVSTGEFRAAARWEKIGGCWSCTQADPALHWMRGLSPSQAAAALLKMGADYEFLSSNQPRVQKTAQAGQSLPSGGEVHSEPQRPLALGTAGPLSTAACAPDRPEGETPQATTGATPGCDSPDWPKTIAQPATDRMATESASVSTMAGCA